MNENLVPPPEKKKNQHLAHRWHCRNCPLLLLCRFFRISMELR